MNIRHRARVTYVRTDGHGYWVCSMPGEGWQNLGMGYSPLEAIKMWKELRS